jgi:hypothetical protein
MRTGCRGEYLDMRRRKWQETGEHYIMRRFVIVDFLKGTYSPSRTFGLP